MNDNQVQKLSDDELDAVAGGTYKVSGKNQIQGRCDRCFQTFLLGLPDDPKYDNEYWASFRSAVQSGNRIRCPFCDKEIQSESEVASRKTDRQTAVYMRRKII